MHAWGVLRPRNPQAFMCIEPLQQGKVRSHRSDRLPQLANQGFAYRSETTTSPRMPCSRIPLSTTSMHTAIVDASFKHGITNDNSSSAPESIKTGPRVSMLRFP
jgi:hypothetical protein